jgi:aminoglycoside phosphotransferase
MQGVECSGVGFGRAGSVRSAPRNACDMVTATVWVQAVRRRMARRLERSRYLKAPAEFAQSDLASVCAALPDGNWRCERLLRTVSDVRVYIMRAEHGETCVLKVASTASSASGLRRERSVLAQLGSDRQLGDWSAVVPVLLAAGEAGASSYLFTSKLPGRDGRQQAPQEMARLTAAAIRAISPLYLRTRSTRVVDDALLNQLVDQPAKLLKTALPSADVADRVDRLTRALHSGLAGRTVTLGMTHGDFTAGNILADDDARVTGIVDWGDARENDLPALDIAFWLLTVPGQGRDPGLGRLVADRLDREQAWTPAERRALGSVAEDELTDGNTLLLLAWLRHIASNLEKSDTYAQSPLWSRRAILPVLRQLAHG